MRVVTVLHTCALGAVHCRLMHGWNWEAAAEASEAAWDVEVCTMQPCTDLATSSWAHCTYNWPNVALFCAEWTPAGCVTEVNQEGVVTCNCNHLTNFAVLVVSILCAHECVCVCVCVLCVCVCVCVCVWCASLASHESKEGNAISANIQLKLTQDLLSS